MTEAEEQCHQAQVKLDELMQGLSSHGLVTVPMGCQQDLDELESIVANEGGKGAAALYRIKGQLRSRLMTQNGDDEVDDIESETGTADDGREMEEADFVRRNAVCKNLGSKSLGDGSPAHGSRSPARGSLPQRMPIA